jgi:type II secretory pathway pseudopilin PulG
MWIPGSRLRPEVPERGQAGISLLEVTIGAAILAVALLGLQASLLTGMRWSRSSREAERAAATIRDKVEEIQGTEWGEIFATFPGQTTDLAPELPAGQLQVTFLTEAEAGQFLGVDPDLDLDGLNGESEAPHGGMVSYAVRVSASWEDETGIRTLARETLITARGSLGSNAPAGTSASYSSGHLVIYSLGDITLARNAVIGGDPPKPSDFQIYLAGGAEITLSSGSALYGVIYNPDGQVNLATSAAVYGAVVGGETNMAGGSSVFFDVALLSELLKQATGAGVFAVAGVTDEQAPPGN